jgi:quinol monooxygenase YgiN
MTTLIFRAKMQNGKEDEALARIRTMCAAVEANEQDTLAYAFHRSQDDPSQAILFESYSSKEALDAHMSTPHMAELRTAFAELFDLSQVSAERLDLVAGFARGSGKPAITVLFRAKALEGREDDAVAAMRGMVEKTQANEPNTIAYVLSRRTDDPAELVFYEAYADDDAFKAHMSTPHMTEMREKFGDLFDPGSVKLERLERVGGFARAGI